MTYRYRGTRMNGTPMVGVWTQEGPVTEWDVLPPRHDLANHSPDGFEWGYGGSGPAQLALALCAHHLGDDHAALSVYQEFKHAVVAKLDRDEWELSSGDIGRALGFIYASRRVAP